MKLFAQITKVDEAKRQVWGRAAQEMPDNADEIMDYASSKPLFEKWSTDFEKITDGKSLGNIRAMHGNVAAGKAIALNFHDEDKAIDIGTEIVDDNEWQKVLKGVYTGFSIGGKYVKKWADDANKALTRYTARPSEISLVDRPCIPSAQFFDIVKADGTLAKVAFAQQTPEEAVDELAKMLTDKTIDPVALVKLAKAYASDDDEDGDDDSEDDGEDLEKPEGVDQDEWDDMTDAEKQECIDEYEKKDAKEDLDKREFSQEQRDKAADSGAALPDGSFPIKTKADLGNAVQAYGRAKDKVAAKRHIIERAKALGAEDMLPKDWEKLDRSQMTKGLPEVQQFASALQSLAYICAGAQRDADFEGDGSPIPEGMRKWIATGIGLFKDMAAEEADELLEGLNTQGNQAVVALAERVSMRKTLSDPELKLADMPALAKKHMTEEELALLGADATPPEFLGALIAKYGARNSKADAEHLQTAHDHLVHAGAACSTSGAEKSDHGDLLKSTVITKLTETVDELKGRLAKLESQQEVPIKGKLRVITKGQDHGGSDEPTQDAKEVAIAKAVPGTHDPEAATAMISKMFHETSGLRKI